MKKKLLLLCLTLLSTGTFAQYLQWAKSVGGTTNDEGWSIATDLSGNVYTTGYFHDTVDFDPGVGIFNMISNGGFSIFILKLDAFGNFMWAKSIGGTVQEIGRALAVDQTGNVCITGDFDGVVDFDPGVGIFNLTSNGGADIFILKLDSAGNFLWAKSMGGTNGGDLGLAIAIDRVGNVYTTGYFYSTVDFDPGIGTYYLSAHGNQQDIFISKLDSEGNFVWAKSIGNTLGDQGNSIAVDSIGNVYTTGKFEGTVDFDPGAGTYNLTCVGISSVFISKLDSAGNFVWAKGMGGLSNSSSTGESIGVDASGNVCSTGWFEATVDFDPGAGTYDLTAIGNYDIFISKLDALGNFIWAGRIGAASGNSGLSLALDASGNIYTTGIFAGTADFDPGVGVYNLTSTGGLYILKLDTAGTFTWAASMGGSRGYSIALDPSENIYTTGYFQNVADFDPGAGIYSLTSSGGQDVFILKIDTINVTGIKNIRNENGSAVYPNPANDVITIQSSNAVLGFPYIITDEVGRHLVSGHISNITMQVDIGYLAAGFYFMQVGGLGKETLKFVKQ